ncbi:60S ribosomal export protein NMD3 [Melipona quadrifasciata]|uniref:60S ribosomal export protein NMD3 n=1 Tax=Melipona quadrifasciata TaxID=166423 RepID=A0A0M8ZSR8_9HYME|nr:60S ribosomal export protein NMD3 [Melipona quadrifasciata]
MEVLNELVRQETMILCCICGIGIESNPANMCVACLRTQIDITKNIPKQATIHFCKGCERYLQPPSEWIYAALESRELLTLCLKRLRGLNRVKLIDAGFVWTEPHSMRLKVKLTVQAEVMSGAILQQIFIVEYTINHQMCNDCHRTEAKDYWRALVQVRQRATNKKTFYYLEQLILKNKAHEQTLGIKPIHEGLDFFYTNEATARKMVDFLSSVIPCRYDHSKKLISHDIHSNIYNYKFTYSVEIVPISRDSVVCLPRKLSHQLGGINAICLVYKITNFIHLIDVATGQKLNATLYWRHNFNSICDPKQLIEYTVMDIEQIKYKDRKFFPGQGTISHKHVIADVWLVRSSDLGLNENLIHTRTHLLVYVLSESNINDENFEMLNKDVIPDVILTKKNYTQDKAARRRMRAWKLKHMIDNKYFIYYYEFLEDIEEDPEMRQNINIFKNPRKSIPVDTNELSDPSYPQISLEEMLEDFAIDDIKIPHV